MTSKVKRNQVSPGAEERPIINKTNRSPDHKAGEGAASAKPSEKKKRSPNSKRGEESSDPPASLGHDKSMRVDNNGNVIVKGGKKHKICFRPELVQIIYVESYKEYNMENFNPGSTGCTCHLM